MKQSIILFKRSLLLCISIFIPLCALTQTISGYVGEIISLPVPTAPRGHLKGTPQYIEVGGVSGCLGVNGSNVEILK